MTTYLHIEFHFCFMVLCSIETSCGSFEKITCLFRKLIKQGVYGTHTGHAYKNNRKIKIVFNVAGRLLHEVLLM